MERGRTRKPHRGARRIGVDEEWIARGHKYEWSVYDVDAGTVEPVRVDKIATASRHCITNALGEAINGKIEEGIRMACRFGNRFHYRTAIYFYRGGLNLFPKPPACSTLSFKAASSH
jgi:hypothetical protein